MKNEINYKEIEKYFVEYILHISGPNQIEDLQRHEKKKVIEELIKQALKFNMEKEIEKVNIHFFCYGSFSFKSYHLNSDIDITIFFEDKLTNKLLELDYNFISKAMDSINIYLNSYFIKFGMNNRAEKCDAEVKLIKILYENTSFEISFHNFSGILKLMFMHHLEQNYLPKLFYKKTLLLIKSYLFYEAKILGSSHASLGSYALETLVIYMFNLYHDKFNNEFEGFFYFFKLMNDILWDKYTVTIYGLIDKESNQNEEIQNILNNLCTNNNCIITYTNISDFFNSIKNLNNIISFLNFNSVNYKKSMHIMDPIISSNNLGKSVNLNNFQLIKVMFKRLSAKYDLLCNHKSNNIFTKPSDYFNFLLQIYKERLISFEPELLMYNFLGPCIVVPDNSSNKEENKNINRNNNCIVFDSIFNYHNNNNQSNNDINYYEYSQINNKLWPNQFENISNKTLINYQNNINNINLITSNAVQFIKQNIILETHNCKENEYKYNTEEDSTKALNFIENIKL